MATIAVVGAGYVGVCTGLVFARHGHRVVLVDRLPERVTALAEARPPFYEPGVSEALEASVGAKTLRATSDLASAVRGADATFLCVGTPPGKDGGADLSQVRDAATEIGRALAGLAKPHVVVVKSTVPPGTADEVVRPAVEAASGRNPATGVGVASNPEFLREGSALEDALQPDRIVVGARDAPTAERVWDLYRAFDAPRVSVDPPTAEAIKYASNAFLALKVSFANEMANLSEKIGVDWTKVAEGIGHDRRIGPQFLRAGAGFGGSCFPKDVAAIHRLAVDRGAPSGLLDAVLRRNEAQPLEAVRLLREAVGDLRGKRIALLGLAFKPDTDDVRETRALPIWRALVEAGARVVAHDPRAGAAFAALAPGCEIAPSVEAALAGSDGAIVQTEWAEYRALDPGFVAKAMRAPVVVDARRAFDAAAFRRAGIRYRAIGLPP